MTERDPNAFDEVDIDIAANASDKEISDGQPHKRSPRDENFTEND